LIESPNQLLGQRLKLGQASAELQQRQPIDQPAMASLHPLIRDQLYTSLNPNMPQQRALHRLAGIGWQTIPSNYCNPPIT
jgi:hypothetical protein